MTETFHCDNKDTLVAYLYGECDPDEHAAVEAHLRLCVACAQEVSGLGMARTTLAAWVSPEAPTGFRLGQAAGVKMPAPVRPAAVRVPGRPGSMSGEPVRPGAAPWWARPLPAWAQVAAAAVVFAAGMALGAARSPSAPRVASVPVQGPAAVPVADVSNSIETLRQEVAQLRQASTPATAPVGGNADVLRQVEVLIRASEERERQELARRTVQLVRDFDLQRRADLVQVQQAIGQIQGTTGAEVRQHRDAIEDLMRRVSQTGR